MKPAVALLSTVHAPPLSHGNDEQAVLGCRIHHVQYKSIDFSVKVIGFSVKVHRV